MSLLRDRRFALLAAGQAVNGIGSWCALVAMWGYAAYKFDAGPAQLALIGLSWSLPPTLIGPVAGVPVDRLGPRRVLVAADLGAAAVSLALMGAGSFNHLLVLGVLHGLTKAFAEPAFSALPPRLVRDRDLLSANAVLGTAIHLSIAVGPLVAAGAIAAWGMRGAFAIDALTYLVGIAVVLPLRLGPSPEREAQSLGEDLREGIRSVRDRPALVTLLGLATSVYVVWGAYAVIEPLYVRDVLHRSPSTFALLQSVFGTTLVLNGFLVSRAGERTARVETILLAALASGLAAVLYVGTAMLPVAIVGIAIWGAATAWFVPAHRTLVQRAAPVETHGRVFALDATLRNGAHVVAVSVTGLLASAAGVQAAAFAVAVVPVAVSLGLVRRRRAIAGDARAALEDSETPQAAVRAIAAAA